MKRSRFHRSVLVFSCLFAAMLLIAQPAHAADTAPAEFEYSDRDFAKDLQAFHQSEWIQTYRTIGHRDDAWDKPALNFMEKFCQLAGLSVTWRGLVPDGVPTAVDLRKLGAEVMSRHCDDPQVRALYGSVLLENGCTQLGDRELRAALRAMSDEKHPAYNILYVCNLLLQGETAVSWEPGELDAVNSSATRAIVRMMGEGQPTRAERYIRYRLMHLVVQRSRTIQKRVAKELETATRIDPWLLGVFLGEHETRLAWEARGNGMANTVTPDGWKGFEEHLQKSHKLLLESMKIDPAVPGPAQLMIPVAMGLNGEGDESPRAWFIRARTAKMDDQWALESLLWSMRPRWGGSYEQILSLGKEFVASNRFDTKVPVFLIDTIWTISQDRGENNAASFGEAETYDTLKTMFDGYARALPKGNGRDYVRSEQAAVAFTAGRYADARTILEQLGPKLHTYTFGYFKKDPALSVSQVYALTGDHADDARAALAEAQSQSPDALKHFTDLAGTCKPAAPDAYFYKYFATSLKFEQDFKTGDWVDIQPTEALYLWQPERGKWEIKGNTLVGTCMASGLMLRYRPKTGNSFEVEAKLEYEPTSQGANACGIFCDHNLQTWTNGVFYSVGYRDVSWYVNRKTGVVSHPLEKANVLHLKMDHGKLSATFNGQPVPIPEVTGQAVDAGEQARLCIAGLYPDAELSLTISDMKIRKLFPGNN